MTWNQLCTGGGNPCAPTVWDGTHRAVKNLVEFKVGQRVLVTGNIIENNWSGFGQDGSAVVLEPADQAGSDIWATVRDFTFGYNILRNTGNAFMHAGSSYAWPSQGSKRIDFNNNLVYQVGGTKWGADGSCFVNLGPGTLGSGMMARTRPPLFPVYYVYFTHNDCLDVGNTFIYMQTPPVNVQSMYLKYNLLSFGRYGIAVNGSPGRNISTAWNPSDEVKNTFIDNGNGQGSYYFGAGQFDPASYQLADSASAVGFASSDESDLRLCAGSGSPTNYCAGVSPYHQAAPDGKDYGADAAIVATTTSCVASGAKCNPHP